MTQDECRNDTRKHKEIVVGLIIEIIKELLQRAIVHDNSKLESPEIEAFTEFTPKLCETVYGSEEYKECLRQMKPAIKHHQENNRHHPEYFGDFAPIDKMNLVDIIEMFCDWKAATLRMKDQGDIKKSIDINKKRFDMSGQLCNILENTVELLEKRNVLPDTKK